MQWMINSLLALVICDPLFLDAKKVVIVMPRPHRRSQSTPWRQLQHFKKNGFPNNGFPGEKNGFPLISKLYPPKDLHFAKDQYPQGGDDFDQDHEEVNHVILPHAKGISHAVSFGKGYIPFDTYKDHRPSSSHHRNYAVERPSSHDTGYTPAMIFPSGPGYSRAFLSRQVDSYIGNKNKNEQDELRDRIHERAAQNFAAGESQYHTTSSPNVATLFGAQGLTGKPSVGVFVPSGIPSATIAGSKQGIIIRDSIAFDDYNRNVQELTKNWPATLGNSNNLIPGFIGSTQHGTLKHLDSSRQFDAGGFSGGPNIASSFDRPRQGYQVNEDVVDTPHDFRTMPIRTASTGVEAPQQHIRYIHQPIQQSLQHIFSRSQGAPQIPLNYGMSNNFQGFSEG